MRGHPTDYEVERNKKSLRQRLLQQFVDDFRIRLATHSLHCLTNEKAEERFLAAAILLNFFGIGGQHIGDDLFDRPSIGRLLQALILDDLCRTVAAFQHDFEDLLGRSEEHTSELQSLMRISYAVFC